ncbi:MAG: hypothetical protein AAFZ63_21540 [Bacteroidota bacterium]
MKRLQDHEPYPAELWEETDAPSWSVERVWQQIETQQAPPQRKAWWMVWVFLLAVVLGGVRWLSETEATTPTNAQVEEVVNPYLEDVPAVEMESHPTDVEQEVPATFVPAKTLQTPSFQLKPPVSPVPLAAPQDSVSMLTLPIAQEQIPEAVPIGPIASPLELLPESVAALPADTRSGTKLKLKIPEIPSADARQGAFAKRLWQQYKRLNTEGEIDWVELGIQPNGDGTFSILPPASKTTSKPN